MASTAISFPDYYQILGIPPGAAEEEIRKAYRVQARRYHPDIAPENPYAPAQFRALKEAYEVLSTPQRRRRYDEERWFRGMTGNKQTKALNGAALLDDSGKLLRHLQRIGFSSVAPLALQNLLFYLLQDKHLAIFAAENDIALNNSFSENVFQASAYLPPRLEIVIQDRLRLLTPISGEVAQKLAQAMVEKRRRQKEERLLPWLVVVVTILLCVLMAMSYRR